MTSTAGLTQILVGQGVGQRVQRAHRLALLRQVRALITATGVFAAMPASQQRALDLLAARDAHVDHQRQAAARQRVPVRLAVAAARAWPVTSATPCA